MNKSALFRTREKLVKSQIGRSLVEQMFGDLLVFQNDNQPFMQHFLALINKDEAHMMREMAEGAVHLDSDTLRLMAAIFGNLSRILEEGAAKGVFRPAHPVLTYFTLISPIIFFRATAPIRAALDKSRIVDLRLIGPTAFVANLKSAALTVLTAGASSPRCCRCGSLRLSRELSRSDCRFFLDWSFSVRWGSTFSA